MASIIQASAELRKKKNLRKGINFTMMVVGQSGSGRSTFINTLCGQTVVETSTTIPLPTDTSTTIEMQLREETVELEDADGVKIALSIIDTPGFGDSLDSAANFNVISDYISHQYDEILLEESRVRRNPRFKDGRVHVLLYFINPTSRGLKEADVEFMKKLASLVNVIPCISKADSLTRPELELNKKLIMEDIKFYQIPVFEFPSLDNDGEDDEMNHYLRSLLPFSLIGSNEVYDLGNDNIVRGRKYPWGIIDVEDSTVSDFVALRNALLITHLNDLKDFTHEVLYERYRTEALSGEGRDQRSVTAVETDADDTAASLPQSVDKDTYMAREEQIRLEEERLKAFEERVQMELALKRKELLQREQELREIEERLEKEASK